MMTQTINDILLENQNLIYSLTHSFSGYSNKDDLFQVGVIGLIKACQKYDANMGVKFTTYAYPFILGEMRKYVREDKGIKISRDIMKLNLKIEKASILLSQKLMREPTITELSQYLEIPEFQLAEAMKSINAIQSLDEPINGKDGKEMSLHETISDINDMDLNSLIQLRDELSRLTPFEKNLIEARYMNDLTQQETAKILGISQVQVSRKEQNVLTKLRSKLMN
jgi:RNA polymerase sporulation-specific sigma factor